LQWEPPTEDVALPPAIVAPARPGRAVDRAGRRAADAAARSRRWPTCPCAAGDYETASRARPLDVPANAVLVDWLSYARTMPHADLVVCHAGHGTLVRALSSGCAVVACPAAGDMNENAARLDWYGAGVRVPRRLLGPTTLRLAVERALDDPTMRARARSLQTWMAANDPAQRAAELVERLAG